jgi:hypothetical protein
MIGVGEGVALITGLGVGVGVGGKLFVTMTTFDGVGEGVAPTIRTRDGVGTGFNSCEKLVEAEISRAHNNIKLLFIQQISEVMTMSDKLFAVSGNTSRILGNRVFKDSL